MLDGLLVKTLRDSRKGIIGFGLGLVAMAFVTAASFPSVKGNSGLEEILDSYPDALLALFGIDRELGLTSPVGYADSQMFANIVPLLLLFFAIAAGVRAIAGEEDKGTLDLLLANPVSRDRIVIHKFGALVIGTFVLAVATGVSIIVLGPPFDLNLGVGKVMAASIGAGLLALAFGSLGLAAGAVTGRRGLSIGIAAGLAVATFVLDGLAEIVDGLEPFEKLSPWFYFIESKPLLNGLDLGDTIVLTAISVVLVGVAMWGFRRRDVRSR